MASYCFGSKKHKDSLESTSSNTKFNKVANTNGYTSMKWINSVPNGYFSCQPIICKEMCYYCFEVLTCNLNNHSSLMTPSFTNKSFPLFVTWTIGKEKKLRGCIGTFSEQPLHNGLKEYALSSAFKDSRFNPISKHEVYRLNCAVSLLTNFELNLKYNNWTIGVHGIKIEFVDEKSVNRSATYLPEVAMEQCWNHVETVDSLIRKAGYKGIISEDLRLSIKLTRYQSEKCCVSYEEFVSHKRNGF